MIYMNQGWHECLCGCGANLHYVDGKRHREDGPSFINYDGTEAWFYDDELVGQSRKGYTQEQFETWKRFWAFI